MCQLSSHLAKLQRICFKVNGLNGWSNWQACLGCVTFCCCADHSDGLHKQWVDAVLFLQLEKEFHDSIEGAAH